MTFNVGDSVIVTTEGKDPDLETDISGWQGRITEIHDETVCITWDSLTLKAIPTSVIKNCEEGGWGWDQFYVLKSEITPAQPRDSVSDVKQSIDEIAATAHWYSLGDEGERIQQVLSGIAPDDIESAFEAWRKHLKKVLKFPIKAEVAEMMERGPLKLGDKVTIHGLDEFVDERVGLLVTLTRKKSHYDFPLADLEAADKMSKNYQLIKDYAIWFANR